MLIILFNIENNYILISNLENYWIRFLGWIVLKVKKQEKISNKIKISVEI